MYPGSVEHYRHYWHKYLPARPFFDRQSQLANFPPADLVPARSPALDEYAEPICKLRSVSTDQRRPPVTIVRTKVNDPVFDLGFGVLEPGLYCVRVIATVDASAT